MGFVYEERDIADHIKRTTQDGGKFDRYLLPDYQEFKPTGGNSYAGRIAPPTWVGPNGEKATHFGYDLWVNYKIGPDEGTYVSRAKHGFPDDDPVQDLIVKLRKDGDKYKDAIKQIDSKRRVLVWWLGRGQEHEGWKLWAMPWTVDKDIAKRAYMKGTGKVLLIDHPTQGYDISFDVTGSKRNTKYEAIDVARMPSPIVEDDAEREKLLQFVVDNPLHQCLKMYDADYIRNLLNAVDPDDLSEDREEDTDKDTGAAAGTRDDGGPIPEVSTQGGPAGQVANPATAPESIDDPGVDLDASLDAAMNDGF